MSTTYARTDSGLFFPDTTDHPEQTEHTHQTHQPEQPRPAPVAATGSRSAAVGEESAASPRVRWARRRAQVRGQLDEVPDTKGRRARRRMDRAVELEELAADPRAEAWSNRRVRSWMLAALALFASGGAVLSAVFSALSVTTALALTGTGWFAAAMGPDLLMGGLLALGLLMRSVTAQRGLTLSSTSHRAYQLADRCLGGLIATITIGPSLGTAVMAGIAWWHGQAAAAFGWALVSVAVHAIGPVVVIASGALAPHITGDLARISQHTAHRLGDSAATSTNTPNEQHTPTLAATSTNTTSAQVTALTAATSDPVIERAQRELGAGASGTRIAKWHRTHIGPISQDRVGQIRDALRTDPTPAPAPLTAV